MGHVIKKEEIKDEEQPDVRSAALTEEVHEKETLGSSPSLIPKEKVDPPPGASRSADSPTPKGPVLEATQTRRTAEAIQIEPAAPKPDSSPAGSSPESSGHEEENERQADRMREDRTPEAEEDRQEEGEAPERTDAEWEEHLEEAVEEARVEGYEKGYSEGYDDGYDEAEATLRAEWTEEREALIGDIDRFEDVWARYIDENESKMVELALQLAEAIVDAPLADSLRGASEEALIDAVAELADTPPVTVTVHPVDYKRLQESGLAEHLTDKYADLRLESDPERAEGDWTVASPAGAIRRRRSEVIDTLRGRLRLSSPGPESPGPEEA